MGLLTDLAFDLERVLVLDCDLVFLTDLAFDLERALVLGCNLTLRFDWTRNFDRELRCNFLLILDVARDKARDFDLSGLARALACDFDLFDVVRNIDRDFDFLEMARDIARDFDLCLLVLFDERGFGVVLCLLLTCFRLDRDLFPAANDLDRGRLEKDRALSARSAEQAKYILTAFRLDAFFCR